MSQFLAASGLMIARLQSQLLPLQAYKVRAAHDLDFVIKNALSSSVNVIFFDDVPDETPAANFHHSVQQASNQFWLVIISAKNVSDVGNASLEDVGLMADSVLKALQGWRLSEQHTELVRAKCPFRKTTVDGFSHLPFMFSCKIVL